MYGVEWLIGLALLGILAGLGGGYLLARGRDGTRNRELESQLAASRRELDSYRQEVVKQFSETARKFQTLNDSYTDLHEQLARSSSVLCGDITGPLLEAPAGHQDLIPAEVRQHGRPGADALATGEARPEVAQGSAANPVDPYEDDAEIRVAEPVAATAETPQHGDEPREVSATADAVDTAGAPADSTAHRAAGS